MHWKSSCWWWRWFSISSVAHLGSNRNSTEHTDPMFLVTHKIKRKLILPMLNMPENWWETWQRKRERPNVIDFDRGKSREKERDRGRGREIEEKSILSPPTCNVTVRERAVVAVHSSVTKATHGWVHVRTSSSVQDGWRNKNDRILSSTENKPYLNIHIRY